VGCGAICSAHLEVLASTPGVEVVVLVDSRIEAAEQLARQHGVPNVSSSVAALAEHDVHIAHILTPPPTHTAILRELLELGIGALVEKPFALSSEEAAELSALAAVRGLPLGVNHNHRCHPTFTRLEARLAAGHIGKLKHVQATWSMPLGQLDAGRLDDWMLRAPKNIIFEQGPHPLSQVHALCGKLISGEAGPLSSRELAPGQIFHPRFSGALKGERATAEVSLGFGQDFECSRLVAIGTDGSLEADFIHDTLTCERKSPWLPFFNGFLVSLGRAGGNIVSAVGGAINYLLASVGLGQRKDPWFASMRTSIQGFHKAIRDGSSLPTSGDDAAEVLSWCEPFTADLSSEPGRAASSWSESPLRPGEVIVLGGAGFIGRRLVKGLLDRGIPVTCLSRRSHGLPPSFDKPIAEGSLRLRRAELSEPAGLEPELKGARCVIHLATGAADDWETTERHMVRGSRALAETCARAGVGRLIYVSSIASLDTGPNRAGEEIRDSNATDSHAGERAVYTRGKAAAEAAVLAAASETGLYTTIVRPGIVIGAGTPMQHSGYGLWVSDNHCVGWGRGDHPLPLVDVEDVADGLLRAALHEGPELNAKAINLAAKSSLSAAECVEELARTTGRDLHFHPRSLAFSQILEIGKWIIKRVGGRTVPYPSYRDLAARGLFGEFSCETARELLGWQPVEEREALLDRSVRVYGN
jgi:predicted dehydrogenase/nucleoside-diphosphate-sugar epimerase